jgi:hypothetical protein
MSLRVITKVRNYDVITNFRNYVTTLSAMYNSDAANAQCSAPAQTLSYGF